MKFKDIAVGAPYDGEEESGIVYIFRGTAEGLNTIPDQVKFIVKLKKLLYYKLKNLKDNQRF